MRDNTAFTEVMSFLSSDKIKVIASITYYKTVKDLKKAIKQKVKSLDKCEARNKVLDSEGKEVGVRYICQTRTNLEKKEYIILFSYGDDLHELSSSSMKHLKLFEKDSCPRSSKIKGRKCPDVYLKRNWLKDQ